MRHSGKTADDPSFRRLAAGGGRRFSRAADRLRRESGDRRPANGGPLRRNRLRRSRLPGRLHGERNPTGSFLRGQDRTLLRMGNADGSHRALRFLSGAMAGDADGENRGRTQKNGIPVFGRSGRFRPKHDHRQ